MPYKPDASEKTLNELHRWARYDIEKWEQRNTRFQRDQDTYLLTPPGDIRARNQGDIIILPDPKTIVRKVSALIARHPNVIEVPAAPGVEPDIAQRIENYLYGWDQAINQQWMLGLHNPYRYDQAFFMVLRGWLTERTMLYPEGDTDDAKADPGALWDHQVIDPANVFPNESGNRITRVTHAYYATAGDLKSDPFYQDFAKNSLHVGEEDEVDDRTTIYVRALYWHDPADGGRNPTWWHAVIGGITREIGGRDQNPEWIKKPTEIGYNPWTIVIGKGAGYRATSWDTGDGFIPEIGTGLLDEQHTNQKHLNRVITKLNELLSLEANPPVTIYVQNGTVKQVSFEPGARNWLTQKDKLEAHRIGPNAGDYQLLWDILQQRADRAGLPSMFFAETANQSGFSAATLMAAGRDILFPFVEGINQADSLKYRRLLEIYRDFGPSRKLPVRMPPDGLGRVMSAEISAADIKKQGTYVSIDRDDMTPQEMAVKVNLGLAALREKAISLRTLRKEWLKIKNPDKENLQVLAEQVYLNEQVISQLVPIALADTGQEKLRQVWEAVQNPLPAQMPPPPGMQAPPGLPPGPPGPPALPPGLPSQALPPAMAGAPGVNVPAMPMGGPSVPGGQLNPLLALITGGAQGGAGAGGLPPIPGTTSPTPMMPPPFPFIR